MIDEYTHDLLMNYLHDIGDFPVLSPAQEYSLMERIRQGDRQAYERFVNCNLKLVVHIAKKYRSDDISLMDIIQEGNKGLLTAVDKFDHTKGNKFCTHAYWWIRQSITRYLRQRGLIWTPEHAVMKIQKIRRVEMELGIDATDERIAERAHITVEQLQEYRQWSKEVVSLESIIGEDDGDDPMFLESKLVDDQQTEAHQQEAEYNELKAVINEALDFLNTKEREVVKKRFGLGDAERMHTLQEISNEYGVSRQRINQMEITALLKLKRALAGVARRMGVAS